MPRTRNLSESSQGSSQYATPPTSPAPSSMLTADEGVFVWLGGSQPTQTDRQVCDALTGVEAEGLLEVYPNLYIYLINLRQGHFTILFTAGAYIAFFPGGVPTCRCVRSAHKI